ncbi:MAG TPA: aspartate 1-decarboxylase [Thermodesulfobacteriota bacterium]|nr:aspartate 1-decarboxylase [Thermodesulfobacteriota bacterium]
MQRTLLKSKIHRVTVREADLEYEGSITIDRDLMDAADMNEYEQVHIFNVTNGHRFVTYVIEGGRGSGDICVNGAAAHLAKKGDILIVASFSAYNEAECMVHSPRLVYVDGANKITKIKPAVDRLQVAGS